MTNIVFIKSYLEYRKGDVLLVAGRVAEDLVVRGFARMGDVRDNVRRTKYGATKAFRSPPSES